MADVPSLLARLAPTQPVDFAAFGPIEVQPLTKVQRLTGAFLGRNWVTVPHVTHHDDVDATALEARRREYNARCAPEAKLTLLPLLLKALVDSLRAFPQLNASLSEDGQSLVLKRYWHIGCAIEVPAGLVVAVVRDVDAKPLPALAAEIAALSEKARTRGLSLAEMSGSSFCVSSLGHIGGTAFTPIINAPDVAILGVTRLREQPARRDDGGIEWRTMLPLSLSYDHRVINGSDAARFVRHVGESLANPALFNF